jgi:hypothetical protein
MSPTSIKSYHHNLLALLAGVVVSLFVLEGIFRLLPVDTGLLMMSVDANNTVMRALPHQPYVYSAGWTLANTKYGTTNNYGFINNQDYKYESRPVVVAGNSFIEAIMNDPEDTLQGQLAAHLHGNASVYSVAASGAHLSDYLVLAEYAKSEFSPRALVVLINDSDVALSILPRGTSPSPGNSYFVSNATGSLSLSKTEYHPSELKQVLRRSALVRYIYLNLKINRPLDSLQIKNVTNLFREATPTKKDVQVLDKNLGVNAIEIVAIDKFLNDLPSASGLGPSRIILVMDDYYVRANAGIKHLSDGANHPMRSYFMERARLSGYQVVDMGLIFEQDFARTHIRFDYLPLDGHWNGHAHELAERAVYPVVMNMIGNRAAAE